jgi:fructosamine-3-kinase
MKKDLLKHLEQRLGLAPISYEAVYGGDINRTYVLTASGQQFFLKLNDAAKADMFEKEKKGLEHLRSTRVITVPEPYSTGEYNGEIYMVMEFIGKGSSSTNFWQRFGAALAQLHRHTAPVFGLDHDNYIGSLPQPNKSAGSWSRFYTESRILHLSQVANAQGKCDVSMVHMAEQVCKKLDDIFPMEPPSLLHGDLWSGNYMVATDGSPCVYDPAIYYGHREMDIGMSLLFGGFDKAFYDHYNDRWPMEKGWQQRVELTQLYPLLVHLVLFGGHYHASVQHILQKYQ